MGGFIFETVHVQNGLVMRVIGALVVAYYLREEVVDAIADGDKIMLREIFVPQIEYPNEYLFNAPSGRFHTLNEDSWDPPIKQNDIIVEFDPHDHNTDLINRDA
jgi:hypothetical protein